MPKSSNKLCASGFKSILTCPCGYTVVTSKCKDDLGTQKDALRMKLHGKKCPKYTVEKSYGGEHRLIPEGRVFQVDEATQMSRQILL